MFICIDEDGFNGRGETADQAYEDYMQAEDLDQAAPPSKCEFFSATPVKCAMKTEPMPKVAAKKPAAKK